MISIPLTGSFKWSNRSLSIILADKKQELLIRFYAVSQSKKVNLQKKLASNETEMPFSRFG